MRCEVINPSDECYLTGEGEALAAAGLFLGEGAYALLDEDGNEVLPFLPGGIHEWWLKTYGRTFRAYLETRPHEAIAAVLETFEYARERTSQNNIAARAKSYANALREKLAAA